MLIRIVKFIKSHILFCSVFLIFLIWMALAPNTRQEISLEIEVPKHHVPNGFKNLHIDGRRRWGEFLRWRFGFGPKEEPALPLNTIPPFLPRVVAADLNSLNHAHPDTIQITWIGHATFLIQVAGINILTDPIFSDRASPVSFAGPRRLLPPAISQEHLPPIQLTIISHNHYDHLDRMSVTKLGNRVKFLVPLGMSKWFREAGLNNVTELDWWQSAEFGKIRLHCVPAQHFSMRTPFDHNKILWASWVLETPKGNIFFAGDTGYSEDFREIGQKLGPMRLALIPIGGYMPRWFMKSMHLNPQEAVQVHQDVQSQQSIGMHWGTFKLTEEPLAEPPLFLQKVLQERKFAPDKFIVLPFGETKILDP
jgi:N-acyl-phosphatidylethanolamine-hydrolysing phospholipase D